jgi:hypothetical protein
MIPFGARGLRVTAPWPSSPYLAFIHRSAWKVRVLGGSDVARHSIVLAR